MTGSEIAQTFLDQDGYIVMASAKPLEIGQVVTDDLSLTLDGSEPVKVVVVGTAKSEDFIRQTRQLDPQYQWKEIPAWSWRFRFYKVTAE